MAENRRKLPVVAIVGAALLAMFVAGLGVVVVTVPVSVSGAASLTDGRQLRVVAISGILNNGVAISSLNDTTTVETGKYVVEFTAKDIVVNGKRIGSLPRGGTDYQLVVDRFNGVKVYSGDEVVAQGS